MILSRIVTQGLGTPPPPFILQGYWSAIVANEIASPTQAFVSGSPSCVTVVQVTPTLAAVVASANFVTASASANVVIPVPTLSN